MQITQFYKWANKLNRYLSARERKLKLVDYYFNIIVFGIVDIPSMVSI